MGSVCQGGSARLAGALAILVTCVGTLDASSDQSLKELSLEDLGNIEVTTVSKGSEELRQTPAAVHVITQDDIRRSGATTIPEILRMAPGLSVARIDSTHWSVGVRGFGDQFSKSLLVLINGRSVYTPLFSGVFWAVQDTDLDDIERIEIIRGPGGTIWGANAVTGVINIVTKAARDTKGVRASIATGNLDRAVASVRYGGGNGSTFDYRVYGKGFDRQPQHHVDNQNFDTLTMGQAGGRADWRDGNDTFSIQADAYRGDVGQSVSLGSYDPPTQTVHYEPLAMAGGNVVGSWSRSLGETHSVQVQGYYDRTLLRGPQVEERRNTFDLDFTHKFALGSRQMLTWGAGARISPSAVTQTVPTLTLSPADHTNRIFSGFVEDMIGLASDRVKVTVGTKLEHHTYTGLELQPAVRVLWQPSDGQSIWGAVARAVRTPSRLERDFVLTGYLGTMQVPTYVRIVGSPSFESERLFGYETGYRWTLSDTLLLDVAAFHNEHRDLESFGASSVILEAAQLRSMPCFSSRTRTVFAAPRTGSRSRPRGGRAANGSSAASMRFSGSTFVTNLATPTHRPSVPTKVPALVIRLGYSLRSTCHATGRSIKSCAIRAPCRLARSRRIRHSTCGSAGESPTG
jgi:iron complex outermembrane recepter protein